MRITVFILKDTVLLEKQRTVEVKTLVRQGMTPQEAETESAKRISDVQCVYAINTTSKEVTPRAIISDIVGDKRYRTQISY